MYFIVISRIPTESRNEANRATFGCAIFLCSAFASKASFRKRSRSKKRHLRQQNADLLHHRRWPAEVGKKPRRGLIPNREDAIPDIRNDICPIRDANNRACDGQILLERDTLASAIQAPQISENKSRQVIRKERVLQ